MQFFSGRDRLKWSGNKTQGFLTVCCVLLEGPPYAVFLNLMRLGHPVSMFCVLPAERSFVHLSDEKGKNGFILHHLVYPVAVVVRSGKEWFHVVFACGTIGA